MKSKRIQFVIVLIFIILGCSKIKQNELLDYIDPMIGTDAHGHTFPGATTPFGMVQLSPSNDFKAWDWCSGYHYSDSILKGFAHTHISGPGLAGLGDILLMPTVGDVKVAPGTEENPESGYRSRFSHEREEASAGYYSVVLDDYKIQVELTATPRVGVHRYTFEEAGMGNVIIDPTHNIMEKVFSTEIEFISDTVVRGLKHSEGEGGNRKVYFYAKFSKPYAGYGTAENDSIIQNQKRSSGENVKAFVRFNVEANESIEVKVALSFVSYEGAKKNFEAEAIGKDFTQIHQEAREMWKDKVSRIKIEGNSLEEERIFYTGMYHAFISPNIISDVDGKYIVEGKEYYSEFTQYSNFSTWDTYRALHPLFTIIEHEKTADFVNSLVSRYYDNKVGLPIWELLGHDNACMIGYSPVSPMADAVLKDIPGIDTEKVFQSIKDASNRLDKDSPNYDRNGMKEYILLNYAPAEISSSVSKTTEQNYYDWCISQVAEKLGHSEDAEVYKKRSIGYRSLYNPEARFLHAKYTTGEWRKMSLDTWDDLISNYVSGNMWGYSTYVPHDVEGLINLIGGKEEFALWLDGIFSDTTSIGGTAHVDISGFIGKYGHGDEPSHHMPYLYNYAGEPWKTQELVNRVMNEFYADTPDGLINNEDLGQMSAWYIFSALGFYPVCPGDFNYIIGTPAVKNATISLANGKTFKVEAKNLSDKKKYIQSATLNGESLGKSFITHKQIMAGGELVFFMGSKPNKSWGTKESELPVSQVDIKNYNPVPVMTYKPFDSDAGIVFEESRMIELKSNTPNAEIYYTLDGSIPGRNSKKYSGKIEITKNAILKAIAFKEGLLPSYVYEREYFKGRNFFELDGYPLLSLETPAGSYGAEDGSQLIDLVTGTLHFGDGKWTGWSGEDMIATIDFGEEIEIKSVSVGYLSSTSAWIFPPFAIEIYISDDNKRFQKITEQNIIINKEQGDEAFVGREHLELANVKVRFLKVVTRNMMTIPEWHVAAGHAPWIFIDEILIN